MRKEAIFRCYISEGMEEEEVVIQIDQTFKKTKNESLKGMFLHLSMCQNITDYSNI